MNLKDLYNQIAHIEARVDELSSLLYTLKANVLLLDTRHRTTDEAEAGTCPYCKGDGVRLSKVDSKYYDCIDCKGTGHV